MISYLGSLVQFSPAAGRAGRCRQISLCVGSTRRVLATLGLPRTGVSVLSPSALLRLPAALYGAGPVLSAVPVFGSSTKARIRSRLRVVSSPASAIQAARGLGALSPGAVRLFPPAPARAAGWVPAGSVCSQELASSRDPPGGGCRPSRISGSLQIGTGACLPCGRGWLLWGWVCPFPLPTAAFPRLALLWSFSVPLFCEPRTAGGVFGPVNFPPCYPTV